MNQASPKINPSGEPELLTRARAGDREAFAALYNEHRPKVFTFIYHRVGADRTLAEDLTQDTFVRALRRIDTFTWQGRDLCAWLVTIARNLVADYFKSSRFRMEWSTEEMRDGNELAPDPADLALGAEVQAGVRKAVSRLKPEQRAVIVLQLWGGLTSEQIAQRIGSTEGAVKTMRYRAMVNLRRAYGQGAAA